MKKIYLWVTMLAIILTTGLLPIQASAAEIPDLTPFQLTSSQIPQDGTHPYGSVLLTFRINQLPYSSDSAHFEVAIEKKIGSQEWIGTNALPSDQCLDSYQTSAGTFSVEQLWVETYQWDGVEPINYRVSVKKYDNTWWLVGQSGYSNVVSVGLQSSKWAETELQKAAEAGLIPDILKGADLTKPINREEFAELAVLIYEKSTGEKAPAASPNPFSDTTNPQILKAYKQKITLGTSETTFSPKVLINREQCAAMLFRTINAINPGGDYGVAGVKDFPDQKHISNWAVPATKYMYKAGIIAGDAAGNFMPKATTTAQAAAGYGMATREQAIILGARAYEKVH